MLPNGRRPLACVEIGGGSVQTVFFGDSPIPEILDGAHQLHGATLAVAVPGIVTDGVVRVASNLGWREVDPIAAVGLQGPAVIVVNDAEAAALGEASLRGTDGLNLLVYLCIGTGIGGAVVRDGAVVRSNLFGHNAEGYGTSFGDEVCRCERRGCLETVAAGWALPDPLDDEDIRSVARYLAAALRSHPLAAEGVVVIGGGIARRYPILIELVAADLGGRRVEPSFAPDDAKSAAAWGLRYALKMRELA